MAISIVYMKQLITDSSFSPSSGSPLLRCSVALFRLYIIPLERHKPSRSTSSTTVAISKASLSTSRRIFCSSTNGTVIRKIAVHSYPLYPKNLIYSMKLSGLPWCLVDPTYRPWKSGRLMPALSVRKLSTAPLSCLSKSAGTFRS